MPVKEKVAKTAVACATTGFFSVKKEILSCHWNIKGMGPCNDFASFTVSWLGKSLPLCDQHYQNALHEHGRIGDFPVCFYCGSRIRYDKKDSYSVLPNFRIYCGNDKIDDCCVRVIRRNEHN